MVTTQGFNALLKLVEEPPPHLRFIFATTEPDKVIADDPVAHPPLPVPADPAAAAVDYLAELCEKEGVAIEPAALPLVVRAGAGSARDTLSVLDQLIGGAGADGRHLRRWRPRCSATRPTACSTRSSTRSPPATARRCSASSTRSIETGQDPRRFAEDLLRRLRDLVIVAAVPDAPGHRADRRRRGPGRAAGRPGRAVRPRRAEPGRRHRRDRADRDARRHRAPAAARADLRPGAAAGRRRPDRGRAGPARPARAADGDHRCAAAPGRRHRAAPAPPSTPARRRQRPPRPPRAGRAGPSRRRPAGRAGRQLRAAAHRSRRRRRARLPSREPPAPDPGRRRGSGP